MNIFYVDKSPYIAAISLVDKHVNKMIVESAQLLANCYSPEMLSKAPLTQKGNIRGYSYYNHKCSVWARKTIGNFNWLLDHARCLVNEKLYRTSKEHFSSTFIAWCIDNSPDVVPIGNITTPALAIKDYPDLGDPVTTYRNYYNKDKKHLFKWTKRQPPWWIEL